MTIVRAVSRILLVFILLNSYSVGHTQADSMRLDQKAINFFDSITLKLDSFKSGRKMIFSVGSRLMGTYEGRALILNDEDKAVILTIPMKFIKLTIKVYGYKGKTIKLYENQTYYFHAGSVFYDNMGVKVESKEILDRLREYSDIYPNLLPLWF